MAEMFSFFDPVLVDGKPDREYNAQQFTDYFKVLIGTGILREKNRIPLKTTLSTPNSSIIAVDTGIAYIEGRYYHNTEPLLFTLDTEALGRDRIDRVVLRLDLRTPARDLRVHVVKGAPAVAPQPPSLVQTDEVYEISLARVLVKGGVTYLEAGDITVDVGTSATPWAESAILPSYNQDDLYKHINEDIGHVRFYQSSGIDTITVMINDDLPVVDPNADRLVPKTGVAVRFIKVANNTGAVKIAFRRPTPPYQLSIDYPVLTGKGKQLTAGTMINNGIYTVAFNGTSFMLQGEGGEQVEYDFGGSTSDVVYNNGGNNNISATINTPAIIRAKNFTLSAGTTITTATLSTGLIILAEGNVVIDGIIEMSEKAGYGYDGNLPIPISPTLKALTLLSNITNLPAGGQGGKGGNSSGVGAGVGEYGTSRRGLGGAGGGGGGGAFYTVYRSATGGNGGSLINFPNAPILTSNLEQSAPASGNDWVWNGRDGIRGQGGQGAVYLYSASSSQNSHGGGSQGGGGGGGGGGVGRASGKHYSNAGLIGKPAGGMVIIIARGNITIGATGRIRVRGGDGGAGGVGHGERDGSYKVIGYGGGGGGGAGGGTVSIYYGGTYTNNGAIETNAGLGGAGGNSVDSGGEGSGGSGGGGQYGISGSAGAIWVQKLDI